MVHPQLAFAPQGNGGSNSGSAGVSAASAGTFTASGDASNKIFNIPHSLGSVPTSVSVEAKSADAIGSFQLSWDATNITVTYQVAPPNASNNVVFAWMAIITTGATATGGLTTTSVDELSNKTLVDVIIKKNDSSTAPSTGARLEIETIDTNNDRGILWIKKAGGYQKVILG